jgi:hypothetical protein
MAAVMPAEAAVVCTPVVVDFMELVAAFTAATTVAACTADIREAALAVADLTPVRVAITALSTVPRLGIRGLGKATVLAIHLQDGISFLPPTPQIWVAPEPQAPPPDPCLRKEATGL